MEYDTMSYGIGDNKIELLLTKEPIDVGDKSLVGMATSPRFPKRVGLVLDRNAEDKRDYDFAALSFGAEKTPFIYLEQIILDGLRDRTSEALTIVFHEIGHYIHGHKAKNVQERYAERVSTLNSGMVLKSELEADRFALEYLGKDEVLSGFEALQMRMRERYTEEAGYDIESLNMAIDELEKRKDVIKSG